MFPLHPATTAKCAATLLGNRLSGQAFVECKTDDPTRELMTRGKLDDIVAPIVKLAMADGNAAIGHVRKHAKEYGVNPDRIGIIGFSAGSTVTASVAFNYSAETRPNFVAPIYLAYNWTIKSGGVPADAPPMFILAATIRSGWRRKVSRFTRTGPPRGNQPNCTCTQRADTASACESKTFPPTTGLSVSPIGWKPRGC